MQTISTNLADLWTVAASANNGDITLEELRAIPCTITLSDDQRNDLLTAMLLSRAEAKAILHRYGEVMTEESDRDFSTALQVVDHSYC